MAASGPNGAGRVCGSRPHPFALLLAGLLIMVSARVATGKSLYVIAQIVNAEQQIPLQAYDIGTDGTLTFQAQQIIPLYGAGAVGLGMDADSQRLFVTYESSNVIVLLDAATLATVGTAKVQGARNLAGIVYDHGKKLLYCMDRTTSNLYVFQWGDSTYTGLIPVAGLPITLEGAQAYGLALDEVKGELYVGNPSPQVLVFSTATWRLTRTILVRHTAISVAVDPVRRYLYCGGAYPLSDNYYLERYDLVNNTEFEARISPSAGVMGLGVDPATGFVFTSTGRNNDVGGDDLLVFNSNLTLLFRVPNIGDPTGLVIPDGHVSFNPLRLTKTVKTSTGDVTSTKDLPQVTVGEELTYSICFDHNDLPLTEVSVVDTLPAELAFVGATGDGTYGHYDSQTHTYTWSNPPLAGGPRQCLDLTCRVDPNTPAGQILTNSVTIDTLQTPPTTTEVEVVTVTPKVYKPLHVSKTVVAGATGGGEATLASAYAGDEVTYRISFDNKANPYPVENVRLTDDLPPQATFVRATGDILFGHYEPITRTYTWSYPGMLPGDSNSVDLVVRLNDDVAGGVTITNTATIVSDNTLATRTSVGLAVTNFAPLWLQKTLAGGAVGRLDSKGRSYVDAGSTLTYAICFSNPATNKTVTSVSIVDTLPREVSFVSADGDRDFGSYDSGTRTYTWRYAALAAGAQKCLNLVVRVNDAVDPNTVIGNVATISAGQVSPTKAQLDVVVRAAAYTPLRLQKTLAGGATGQADGKGRPYVDAGSTITYAINFSNPATNKTVTSVSIVDTLPREVTFVSADGDRDFGTYDSATHTYTWRYGSLAPGAEKCLNLVVRVSDKVAPDTVISNSATISTGEVSPTKAQLDVVARPASVQGQMYVKPDHIYRNNSTVKSELMVVVHLPEGIGMGAITNTPLVLTPGNVTATGQLIFGTSTQGKVLGFFDVDPILAATQGYGEFTLKVTGKLNDGRSFYATSTIWILKFGGP
jgi:uncharacterized repeat protein (TIGR01451 family)